jgi:hypothetical protein
MTPMPTTTDGHPRATPATPPAGTACRAPLPDLGHEPRPASGPRALRYIRHPQELALRGMPVFCRACNARRDWLLMNQGRDTWIYCRCGTRRLEPEITRAGFEALVGLPDTVVYPTVAAALAAMGFDGGFAGMYLE